MRGRVTFGFTLIVTDTEHLALRRENHGTHRHVTCGERP
jgi:hypothetical protein